jgi:hypothetical protein
MNLSNVLVAGLLALVVALIAFMLYVGPWP